MLVAAAFYCQLSDSPGRTYVRTTICLQTSRGELPSFDLQFGGVVCRGEEIASSGHEDNIPLFTDRDGT